LLAKRPASLAACPATTANYSVEDREERERGSQGGHKMNEAQRGEK